MSEVLTRSLITGLSTVFLIGVLLIFGGETLKDFAFAMLVGVASGTYSSIFIAAPVLTAWKEREPGYHGRRMHLQEAMGYVPAFPEENVVARVEEVEEAEEAPVAAAREAPAAPAAPAAEPPREPEPTREPAPPVGAPGGDGQEQPPGDGAPQKPAEPVGTGAGGKREEPQRESKPPRRRQSRRRRKHGRHR
jgi:SecD/SecF fusion protein